MAKKSLAKSFMQRGQGVKIVVKYTPPKMQNNSLTTWQGEFSISFVGVKTFELLYAM